MKKRLRKVISMLAVVTMVIPMMMSVVTASNASDKAAPEKTENLEDIIGKGRDLVEGTNAEELGKWINETLEVEAINGKEKYDGVEVEDITTEKQLQKLTEPGDIVELNQVEKRHKTSLSEKLGLSMSASAAAGDTVTVTPGAQDNYRAWVTSHFTVKNGSDKYTGFCAQPNRPTTSGTFTARKLNNDLIKFFCLLYEVAPDEFDLGAGVTPYASAHAAIAYLYSGDTTGLLPQDITNIQNFIANARTVVENRDRYPNHGCVRRWDRYTLYVAVNASQDIVWIEENGGIGKLVKSSANTTITNGNSSYSLAGAKYTVYKDSSCSTIAKDMSGNNAVFTTDASGNSSQIELECATYYVKETTAAPGFALDTTVHTMKISPGQTTTLNVKDAPQALLIYIKKNDAEHKEVDGGHTPTAGATLAGAEITITYAQGNRTWKFKTVEKNGKYVVDPQDPTCLISGTLYRDQDNRAVFPLGTYTIKETAAPEGYMVNEQTFTKTIDAQSITSSGNQTVALLPVTHTVDNPWVSIDDQVTRGDYSFTKIDPSQDHIRNCPFIIIEKTTGEAHIIVTNDDGLYLSDGLNRPRTSNVNGNDQAVTWKSDGTKVVDDPDRTDDEMVVDESALNYRYGTWFSWDGEHKSSAVDRVNGAFAYSGNYQIREIRSSANEGWGLISWGFSNKDLRTDNSGIKDGGTKSDDPITIQTSAHDKNSNTQISYTDTQATIVDKVSYHGLKKNETYVIKGELHKKNIDNDGNVTDGGVFKDAEGNPVTATKEFTATGKDGFVNVEFVFNSTGFGGEETVVFEKLFATDGTTEPLARHEEADDNDQSITIEEPEIGTTANDKASDSHTGSAEKETVVVDTVKYTNLKPGKEYTVEGVLHLKGKDENGKILDKGILVDADGKEVRASKTFTPEKKDGSVDLEFKFNSSLLYGESVVAFEEVKRDNFVVATHQDITDKDQTIEYPKPEIGTTLTGKGSGEHTAAPDPELTLVDTVKYKGLSAGTEYIMTGTLMDRETGKPLSVDGKDVTATTTFTPEKKDGTVDITFKFSSIALEGKSLVAFEELTLKTEVTSEEGEKEEKEIVVAEHKDLEDKGQTVKIEPITVKTNAEGSDGNRIGAEAKQTIIDTVTMTGLEIGKEYTVTGKVYDKSTGKPIAAKGSTTFVAKKRSQSVKVKFTINATNLKGKTLVVGEDLYRQDKKVAAHFDLEDRAQTVTVAPGPLKTGDARMLIVLLGLAIMTVLGYFGLRKVEVK